MQGQMDNSILEKTPRIPSCDIIHYIPHQAFMKGNEQSVKIRVVNDCLAKFIHKTPILNHCLGIRRPTQALIEEIPLKIA